jgi:hypothetical protein
MPKNKLHQVDFKAGLLNRKFQNFPEHPVYKSGLSLVENFEYIDDQGLSSRRSTRLLGLPTDLKGFSSRIYYNIGTANGDGTYSAEDGYEYSLESVVSFDKDGIIMVFKNDADMYGYVIMREAEGPTKSYLLNTYTNFRPNPIFYAGISSKTPQEISITTPVYPQAPGTSIDIRPAMFRPAPKDIAMIESIEKQISNFDLPGYLIVSGKYVFVQPKNYLVLANWFGTFLEYGEADDHYVDVYGGERITESNSFYDYDAPVITPLIGIEESEKIPSTEWNTYSVQPEENQKYAKQLWVAEPWNINKTYNKGDVVSFKYKVVADFANAAKSGYVLINFEVPEDNYTKIPIFNGLSGNFDRDTIVRVGNYYTIAEDANARLYGLDLDDGGKHFNLVYQAATKGLNTTPSSSDIKTYCLAGVTSGNNLIIKGSAGIYRNFDSKSKYFIQMIRQAEYIQDRLFIVEEDRLLISRVGWYWDFFDSTDPDGGMAIYMKGKESPVWIANTTYGIILGTTRAEYLIAAPGAGVTPTTIQLTKISDFGTTQPSEPDPKNKFHFSYGGGFYFLSKKGLARLVYSQEKQSYDVSIYDLFSSRIVGPMKNVVKDMGAGYVYIQDQEGIKALNFEGGPFANGYDFELDSVTFEGNGFTGEVNLFDYHGKAGFYTKGHDANRPLIFVLEDMENLPLRCDLVIPEDHGEYLDATEDLKTSPDWKDSYIDSTYQSNEWKGIVKTDNGDGTTRVDLPDIGLRYDVDPATLSMDINTDWTLKDGAQIVLFSTDADLTQVKIHGTYTDDRKTYDVEHPNVTFLTQTTDWNDGLGLFWVGFNFTSRFKTVPALNMPGTSTTAGKVWIQLFDTLGGKLLANDKSYDLPLTTEEIAGEEFTGRKSRRVDVGHTEEGVALGFEAADFRRAHINSLSIEAEVQEDK